MQPAVGPDLNAAIARAADPTHARLIIEQLLEANPALSEVWATHPNSREATVAVVCASRSLTRALSTRPELISTLADCDTPLTHVALRASLTDALDAAVAPMEALRAWKQEQLLRIAARDLLGFADLPTVGRELAALAEMCLAGALRIAEPTIPFAIIGMGKLGGAELNYSSDVDVLFVHDGPLAEGERIAKAVLTAMTKPMPQGIVFRTDANLRPEGRSGALSRQLVGYQAYWDQWAQAWERQSLIKARPVAGDVALGNAFTEAAQHFVWNDALDPDAIRSVRAMKQRSEALLRQQGRDTTELKRGTGGIRDIEFAVQILQLVHGRHDPALRRAATLDALDALARGGYIEREDAVRLDESYQWLRTVEHRLQLVDEQQTHTLPGDPAAGMRLANVLGFRSSPEATAWEHFSVSHRAYTQTVRTIHERLFFRPLLERMADTGPLSAAAASDRLAAFGFLDAQRTRTAVEELSRGHGRRAQLMEQLLPLLLDWSSVTPDPDLALLQLRKLLEDENRARMTIAAFRDVPDAAERTCTLLGSSRLLGDALIRQPEYVAILGDDVALQTPRSLEALVHDATATLQWRGDDAERQRALRRFKRREFLRIATRDVLGFADVASIGKELTALADATLTAALGALAPEIPFAIIGMGRLGGGELSYASDIDVLFVTQDSSQQAAAEQLATDLLEEISAITPEGQAFRIDLLLRPEGNNGPLARSIDGYREYYARYAATWERQALVRARAVAGDPQLLNAFLDLAHETAFRPALPEDDRREIRRVKARVERERIPTGEDPQLNLKLGRGGLVDVEFTAQLLQLEHGGNSPHLRVPGTVDALESLRDAGVLGADDADALVEAYRHCERIRNARYLMTGRPIDSLPTVPEDAQKLGRLLGYLDRPQADVREDYKRLTRRARAVVERVFYGS
ncbi:MAG: bifunctional [glutamine synthetase] adenylyltransferase/[glutamine synthetase]-adenylyl-L-tyrosine phosphorylase [Acidimicrobiia bacterium]